MPAGPTLVFVVLAVGYAYSASELLGALLLRRLSTPEAAVHEPGVAACGSEAPAYEPETVAYEPQGPDYVNKSAK